MLKVKVDNKLFRPSDIKRSSLYPGKIKKYLGWEAKYNLDNVIEYMIEKSFGFYYFKDGRLQHPLPLFKVEYSSTNFYSVNEGFRFSFGARAKLVMVGANFELQVK